MPSQSRQTAALPSWENRTADGEADAERNFTCEFEDALAYLEAPARWQSRLKTTNPIERFVKELNKRIVKVGIFPSSQSRERCILLVWQKLQQQGYGPTKPSGPQTLFTQTT